MATKKIVEKKTGEKYASKAAMMKHEKGESKAMQKKEMAKGPMQKKSPAMMKVSKKTAYNIKEASNQKLSASARKHYAENAQAAMKNKKSPVHQEKIVKTAKAVTDLAVTGAKYLGKKAWEGIKALDRQAEGPTRQLKSVNKAKYSAKKTPAPKMKNC